MIFPLRAIVVSAALVGEAGLAVDLTPEDTSFFESKVRPILTERCLECHSPGKKIKGGLRLDSREGWERGGDSGPALAPGSPEDSLLLKAISYREKDLKMPPKKRLSAQEVATLEEWVRRGAPDPRTDAAAKRTKQTGLTLDEGRKFWAYSAPVKRPVPAVAQESWPRTDLDRFILAALEEKQLAPAADASPEVLARRLYLNLIGLPPSAQQLATFVESAISDSQSAIEKLADELLASAHFGETWGRHWLDVARFAESSGGGRTLLFQDAWRYRDYVIEAFNEGRPFDQFIREQIAGDLLPAANSAQRRRQLTATGFLTLGPTNYEEQDKQQLRFDVIDEQLDTVGKAFLGQTIGCARCHDHKFDPIPQSDYYAMAGIMASTRTLFNYTDNVARWIDTPLPFEGEQEAAIAAQETKLATLKKELETRRKELAGMRKASNNPALTARKGQPIEAAELPGIVVDDNDAKAIGTWKPSQYTPHYIGTGYRTDLDADKGRKTLTFTPKLPASARYEVRLAYPAFPNRAARVPVHVFHADGEETVFVDQTQEPPIDGRFVSLGRFRFEKDGAGYVLVSNEGTKGYVGADAVQFVPEEELLARTATPAGEVTKPDAAAMLQVRVKELEAELKKATESGPRRPQAMSVGEAEEIADTAIRVRGIIKQRGGIAPRGFLRVAFKGGDAPAIPPAESGRRELADWLASGQNPLTARVFVNRVWHWLFGAGLVRTTDNFGTTGEKPSHPELLDYLAVQFVEQGWNVKKLIREIVLSRTWQLAVASNAQAADPDNRLLSHANRRRLDAEQIRDTVLAVSGALKLDLGGPNIAGAGTIDANDTSAQNIEYKYEFTDTRRSVYTPAFRNKRLELFEVFDFGDINATMGKRTASTVAPQALYLLNHPFIVAQARLAAERALAGSVSDAERITQAFLATLGRAPVAAERAAITKFLSAAGDDAPSRLAAWSELYQSLFACIDFRYLE